MSLPSKGFNQRLYGSGFQSHFIGIDCLNFLLFRENISGVIVNFNKMVMDQNIQRGKAWLEKLLSLMGISTQVNVEEKDATEMSAGIW